MNKPPKRTGRAYWKRVEDAGETMELAIRLCFGIGFAFLFSSLAWWVGSGVWIGVAAIAAAITFPIGFLIGFFWLEVKYLVRLILGTFGSWFD